MMAASDWRATDADRSVIVCTEATVSACDGSRPVEGGGTLPLLVKPGTTALQRGPGGATVVDEVVATLRFLLVEVEGSGAFGCNASAGVGIPAI